MILKAKDFEINEKPVEKSCLVGVYGTLKKGWGNHRLLEPLEPEDIQIEIQGLKMYYAFPSGYPGVVLTDDNSEKVLMETYLVTPERLRRLDGLEGIPHLYRRMVLKKEISELEYDYIFYMYNRMINEELRIKDNIFKK
jgi:gamma-glutamylcyclotransferase (GGCT)/AIG2-like uncharacterized protein YtfP